jgi:prolyl-tRNA synthetase
MELRAKSGILRGREFIMKDFYSFHRDEKDLKMYYEIMKRAYREVFKRVGIGERTYVTYASGGSFSKYSHEFQTLTSAGEDIIYLCDQCAIAVNKEIKADQPNCPQCGSNGLREEKAIEVGNIFELKTKFTEPFKVTYKDEKGELQPVVMGCYGIGLGRVMGTIVEVLSDDKGIVWPESVAPFRVHLISLKSKTGEVEKAAEELYKKLRNENVEVLFDDRDATAGQKLNDADLLGIPYRVVVSEKTLEKGGYEVRHRRTGEEKIVKADHLVDHIK